MTLDERTAAVVSGSTALCPRWAERVYGALLCAYPGGFRARFETGMRDAFAHEYASARSRGRLARWMFWIVTTLHALWFGMAERLSHPAPRPQRAGFDHHGLQGGSMTSLFSFDWRDAYRSLRAAPVVTAVAVFSLALGIGANTALFSILNSLLLKSLPVHEPSQLVMIDHGSWTNPIWEQIRDRQHDLFDSAFAWSGQRFDLSAHGETDYVDGSYASGGMFDVLGVHAQLGRMLATSDDVRGAGADTAVAVVSDRFWRQRLGGAPDVIGRALTVEHVQFTIVGVMPADFFGADVGSAADLIIPIASKPLIEGKDGGLDNRSNWWLSVMARLKPGQTIDDAMARLRGVQPQIRTATLPERWSQKQLDNYIKEPFTLVPAGTGDSELRTKYEQPLTAIMVVVGAVLLIACANIANLLLARATARRHELSLRLALGASRWRLARQLLAESLMLSGAGAVLGLLFAQWGSALLVHQLATSTKAVFLDLAIDWRVLAFTAGVAVVTAVLFGLAPAMSVVSVAPNEALKDQSRSVAGDRRFGVRNALVIAQVALSLSLVVAAGLFVRTFASLVTMPLGFNPAPLLVVNVNLQRHSADERALIYERMRQVAASVPGVKTAATSVITPISGSGWNTRVDTTNGPALTDRERLSWVNGVSPGWFDTYGMRLSAGRDFNEFDQRNTPRVAVVNAAFARRFFGTESPIGRDIHADVDPGPDDQSLTIVGVVGDAVYRSARSGITPTMYLPITQITGPWAQVALTVQGATSPQSLERSLAVALAREDNSAAFTFRPLADQVGASVTQERVVAMLAGFFGGLALLLAGLGLFGVTSYSVSRRRAEIGVRLALGANPSDVVSLVLGRVAWLVGAGVVAGAGLSLWASHFVASLLFGLQPRDPLTLVVAALVLTFVGALAGWLPARRASRIDPSIVLRDA